MLQQGIILDYAKLLEKEKIKIENEMLNINNFINYFDNNDKEDSRILLNNITVSEFVSEELNDILKCQNYYTTKEYLEKTDVKEKEILKSFLFDKYKDEDFFVVLVESGKCYTSNKEKFDIVGTSEFVPCTVEDFLKEDFKNIPDSFERFENWELFFKSNGNREEIIMGMIDPVSEGKNYNDRIKTFSSFDDCFETLIHKELDKMVKDDLVKELENLVKTDENGSYILKKSLIKLAEENKLKEKENEKEDPLKKLVNENFFKNWEEK